MPLGPVAIQDANQLLSGGAGQKRSGQRQVTEFLIGELRRAVRSSDRKPLIVCGAGVSTQATNGKAPSWAKLIQSGIKRVVDVDANAGAWANESRLKLEAGGT